MTKFAKSLSLGYTIVSLLSRDISISHGGCTLFCRHSSFHVYDINCQLNMTFIKRIMSHYNVFYIRLFLSTLSNIVIIPNKKKSNIRNIIKLIES